MKIIKRHFYAELDEEEERCDDDQTVAEESKQFWGNIWSQSAGHKKDAKWLKDLRSEVNVKKQEKIDIATGSLKKILGRMPNWKSPGPDLLLLPEEQKGCRKGSRVTNDLLYIDRTVIKEVKCRNKNLAMAWIDYKKAYDMVPHMDYGMFRFVWSSREY